MPIPVPMSQPTSSPPTETEVGAAFRRAPDRYLDVGHSRLAAWRFGQGPDLVFIHGWPLGAATFRKIVPLLCDAFTCHLVDLPGAGKTELGPEAPIDLVAHATTMRAAIDALGLTRYALVAHDSGGYVARLVAADDPRACGLALGGTEIPGHTPWLVAAYALLAKLPGGMGLIRTMLRSRALRTSRLGFAGCFVDPTYVEGEFHELFVAPLLASPRAAAAQLRLLENVNGQMMARLRPVHAKIRVPVQLVWGTDDPFFPIAKARQMLGQFGGPARLDEIEGARLFSHEDRPEQFVALARPFLEKCLAL
jgi:pimeloyl-ACP methyl ester carboxylesterase